MPSTRHGKKVDHNERAKKVKRGGFVCVSLEKDKNDGKREKKINTHNGEEEERGKGNVVFGETATKKNQRPPSGGWTTESMSGKKQTLLVFKKKVIVLESGWKRERLHGQTVSLPGGRTIVAEGEKKNVIYAATRKRKSVCFKDGSREDLKKKKNRILKKNGLPAEKRKGEGKPRSDHPKSVGNKITLLPLLRREKDPPNTKGGEDTAPSPRKGGGCDGLVRNFKGEPNRSTGEPRFQQNKPYSARAELGGRCGGGRPPACKRSCWHGEARFGKKGAGKGDRQDTRWGSAFTRGGAQKSKTGTFTGKKSRKAEGEGKTETARAEIGDTWYAREARKEKGLSWKKEKSA